MITREQAIQIASEMQLWRRGEPPYDGEAPKEYRMMPYTPREFGMAIDTLISIAMGG